MLNRLAPIFLIALYAVVSGAASAQVPAPSGPRELTALDYFEIQQLVAKYARAIDTCSNNGYDYADLFTPDGSFVPSFNGKPLAPHPGARTARRGIGWRITRLQERSGGSCRESVTSM